MSTKELIAPAKRVSLFLGLTLGCLLTFQLTCLADYQPQGGDPPPGQSSTSGMRF